MRPWNVCATFPSRTWGSPRSIIIARCATGFPKSSSARGRLPTRSARSSASLLDKAQNVLVTRAEAATAERLKREHPEAEYFPASGAVRVWRDRTLRGKGKIAVVCAGTSDMPVAEEAQVTAEVMGNEVIPIHDIGVAGIHRVMQNRERLSEARVVIVCAGMEGALPSVVGRPGDRACDCRAHQHRLRRQLPGAGGAAGDAEQLRQQRHGGEYR